MRKQSGYPEVPLEQLIREWEKPVDAAKAKSQSKKRTRRDEKLVKHPLTSAPQSVANANTEVEDRANRPAIPTEDVRADVPERRNLTNQGLREPDSTLEWNREHHRFLLRRLDQIWGYLDAEEQHAVQELLERRIGKEEIDQIDEIVKGVEWVRRLEK